MNIADILSQNLVLTTLHATNKEDVLLEMAEAVCANNQLPILASELQHALIRREELGSTGVGEGVAIPHTEIPGLDQLIACFGRPQQGIAFNAVDQQPVFLIFMLLVPEHAAKIHHLRALAKISRLLRNPAFRHTLLHTDDPQELYRALVQEEQNVQTGG